MKKSTLFVSAALTAFILSILAGVVMTFNNLSNAAQVSAAAPATVPAVAEVFPTTVPNTPTTAPTAAPAATALPTPVSPQDAAGLAAQFLNQQDVYSVETATLDGANVYKVVFSSGDIVYVGLDGKIISNTKIQPVVVNVPAQPTPKPEKRNNNNNNNGGGEHEEHEEHEENED
jgi:hypothetical protein